MENQKQIVKQLSEKYEKAAERAKSYHEQGSSSLAKIHAGVYIKYNQFGFFLADKIVYDSGETRWRLVSLDAKSPSEVFGSSEDCSDDFESLKELKNFFK